MDTRSRNQNRNQTRISGSNEEDLEAKLKPTSIEELQELHEHPGEDNERLLNSLRNLQETPFEDGEFAKWADNVDMIKGEQTLDGTLQGLVDKYETIRDTAGRFEDLITTYKNGKPHPPETVEAETADVEWSEDFKNYVTMATALTSMTIGAVLGAKHIPEIFAGNQGPELFPRDILAGGGLGFVSGLEYHIKHDYDEDAAPAAGALGGMIGGGGVSLYAPGATLGSLPFAVAGYFAGKALAEGGEKVHESIKQVGNHIDAMIENSRLQNEYENKVENYEKIPQQLLETDEEFRKATNEFLTVVEGYLNSDLAPERTAEERMTPEEMIEGREKFEKVYRTVKETAETPGLNLFAEDLQGSEERYDLGAELQKSGDTVATQKGKTTGLLNRDTFIFSNH